MPGLTAGRESALLGCVQDLARAARETSYVALDRRQLEDYLQDILAGLVRAPGRRTVLSTAMGYRVGSELVAARFTGPEISGRRMWQRPRWTNATSGREVRHGGHLG